MTKYDLLTKSKKNLFNVDDLAAIWSTKNRRQVLESVKGYIKRGKIYNPYKGIYSLNEDYNQYEFAQKLFTPSYISYYSALTYHGIIFQKYNSINLFALSSKKIVVKDKKYIYHKIKDDILFNTKGLLQIDNYTIASPERAICDSLYLNKSVAFDNLRGINWDKLSKISQIYNNKRLIKDVMNLISKNRSSHA